MITAMLAELVYIQLADLADSNDTLLVQLACPACPVVRYLSTTSRKTELANCSNVFYVLSNEFEWGS